MLDELKDIDRELDRLKRRVRRLISHLEKRQVRLMQLSDEAPERSGLSHPARH